MLTEDATSTAPLSPMMVKATRLAKLPVMLRKDTSATVRVGTPAVVHVA